MTIPDVPAAHSMDTTWFAVDADGNVGVFESGEAGGVPEAAALGMSPGGESIDTSELDVLRLARVLARPDTKTEELRKASEVKKGERVVAMIDRARGDAPETYRAHAGVGPFERALGDDAWVLSEAPRIVTSRSPLTAAAAKAIADDRTVLGVVDTRDLHEWLDPKIDSGVFAWWNDDYADAGRYVRAEAPAAPIRIDELPQPLREALDGARMPKARFVETKELALGEQYDPKTVFTWGGTLADADEDGDPERDFDDRPAPPGPVAEPPVRGAGLRIAIVVALVVFLIWWLSR